MRYALRNIGRLKVKSIISFAIAFTVLFLSMFSVLVILLSEDNRSKFYGPLDGAFHVTDDGLYPYLTYDAAMTLCEDTDAITKVSAVKKIPAYLMHTEYIGKGDFKRPRLGGEEMIPPDYMSDWKWGTMLCAVTSMDILDEVFSGDLVMTEGTMIQETDNENHHNKAVISKKFAEKNNLKLGDCVSIFKYVLYYKEEDQRDSTEEIDAYTYIVGGIYENRLDDMGAAAYPWLLSSNQVYVPISTIVDISHMEETRESYYRMPIVIDGVFNNQPIYIGHSIKNDPAIVPDSLYFHLSNRGIAKELENEINDIGMEKPVVLTEYVSDAAASPSVRLSSMMSILLIGIVGVGFAVFLFALLFNLKSRHRELAVLSALGKKRNRISFSFFLETLILTGMAFLFDVGALSLVIAVFAVPFTKYLYAAEISAKFASESVNTMMRQENVEQFITEDMGDFSAIFKEYAIPSIVASFVIMVILMGLVYLFIHAYVKRINALTDVGGKE